MKKNKPTFSPDEFLQASRRLAERIRKADTVDDREIDDSFRLVMGQVKEIRSHSKLRRLYWWAASAAAVVGLLFVATWWVADTATPSGLDIALLNDTTTINNGEVTLVAGNQAVNLKNESFLKYDAGDSLNLGQYVLDNQTTEAPVLRNEMHKIVVPDGKRVDIVFSDGTKMYINSGSKVIYPAVFADDKREILVEGEVYLDVAKNPHCPFIVKTKGFDIRVLGTSFNVSAYGKETSASVVLVQGSVVVTTEDKHEVQLKPNQLIDIKGNQTQVREVDVSEYISWKENMLKINQKHLDEVFSKLALYYGYRIQYTSGVAAMSITGKLDLLPDIKDVLDNLCLSFPLKYTMNESKEIYVSLKK
mgnify:FL=1